MMTSQPSVSILHLLKAGTSDIHLRLEGKLPFFDPAFDLTAYRDLLGRFYGYWAPLEEQLCRLEGLHHPDLSLSSRLKAHLLEEDLRFFDTDPGSLPRCARLPGLGTVARGLGCLYVVEGSTLGAEIIARRLRERFHLEAGAGASFFTAYGGSAGRRWSEFREFVLANAADQPSSELLSAARDTFLSLEEWL